MKLNTFSQRIAICMILFLAVATILSCSTTQAKTAVPEPDPFSQDYMPISLSPFTDSFNHARYQYPNLLPPYEIYTDRQITGIAENFLVLQNPDGGWPKNIDWAEKMSASKRSMLRAQDTPVYGKSTLDNQNVFTQIEYLAKAYKQVSDPRYQDSILKALRWILDSQDPVSGGLTGADVHAITYNDDVMEGALRIMREVSRNDDFYGFLPIAIRTEAKNSYDKGIACILRTQIYVNGKLTAWGQQHSHDTLEPIWARAFEPPAITASESVGVIELLMEIENPSEEIKNSIVSACEWLTLVAIPGKRVIKKPAPPATLSGRFSDYENILVDDPTSLRVWARFYDLEKMEPLYYDRNRVLVQDYNDISRERRVGYGYIGTWPETLLSQKYPAWKARVGL